MTPQRALKHWFCKEHRPLPWRNNPSPYAVWVSEVMLQQTQVAVVIPYFERWMARFPTLLDVASAPLEEVIKLWEGLGYYSRARNLHLGAKMIVERFGGVIPETQEELAKIKGLGPYTVGAILSFAFHKKVAAVDGNVLRVLSRYFSIEEAIDLPKTRKKITALAEAWLPDKESWLVNEALIELGATLCKKQPLCYRCPLLRSCQAAQTGRAEQLPLRRTRQATKLLFRAVALIVHQDHLLLRQCQEGEIMSGLFELPYFEIGKERVENAWLEEKVAKTLGLRVSAKESLPEVKHSFTRYRATLRPVVCTAKERLDVNDFDWYPLRGALHLPFSSGHRRLLRDWLAST